MRRERRSAARIVLAVGAGPLQQIHQLVGGGRRRQRPVDGEVRTWRVPRPWLRGARRKSAGLQPAPRDREARCHGMAAAFGEMALGTAARTAAPMSTASIERGEPVAAAVRSRQ